MKPPIQRKNYTELDLNDEIDVIVKSTGVGFRKKGQDNYLLIVKDAEFREIAQARHREKQR